MADLPKSPGSPETPTEVEGRSAAAATVESALSGVRLWAVNGVAQGEFEGEARSEPLLSTGHLYITMPGSGFLTIFFKDYRGNLKPFPRAAFTIQVFDGYGANVKWWALNKDSFTIAGPAGQSFVVDYSALGC